MPQQVGAVLAARTRPTAY